MTFERTYNLSVIQQIMTHPAIWPHTTDDFDGDPESFQPRMDPLIHYVLVKDHETILGLFVLYPQNRVCWEIHVRLLPEAWGETAAEAARGIIEWCWRETPAQRLVTHIIADNKLALRYARRAGMQEYGRNPQSWQKRGRLVDQVLMGISREAA